MTLVLWAEDLIYTPPPAPAAPDATGLLLRLVGLTVGLIALCVICLWLARRANRPRTPTVPGVPQRIHHQGSLPLDRQSTVHLFRVDGQSVAVTTDATGLRSIVVLSEPFEAALADATPPTDAVTG